MPEIPVAQLLDKIRSLSLLGLKYSKDPYDLERYQELFNSTCQSYAERTGLGQEQLAQYFLKEINYGDYITPRVGCNGTIVNDEGKLLLIKRADDKSWAVVSGWCECGERPEETLIREFQEEVGLDVSVLGLVEVFSRVAGEYNLNFSQVGIVYACKLEGPLEPKPNHEVLDLGFFDPKEISLWHKDHQARAFALQKYFGDKSR